MQCAGRPFLSFVKYLYKNRGIHTRLTGTTGSFSRIYHQVGSSLSSSSSSFTARIRWPKLPIFFEYRLPTETAENGTGCCRRFCQVIKASTFRFWTLGDLHEVEEVSGLSICQTREKHNNFGTADFLLPFHDKMMK